jgi:L,D-transpeptidase catalytic domain
MQSGLPTTTRGPLRASRRALRAARLPVLLLFGLLAAAPAAGAAQGEAAAAPPGLGRTVLSNLHTSSQWAYPTAEEAVRAEPSAHARALGSLRFLTGDKQAQIYLALASQSLDTGEEWVEVELPGRPNGQTGWVPRAALGALHSTRGYLLVNRTTLRLTLFNQGRAIFTAPVAVGKASTATPPGRFYVVEKLKTVGNGAYGPFALGTSAYAPTLSEWPGGGVVGIHGTNEPKLIPGRPSHGCVRLRNADMTRLWRLVPVGTPIEIV